MDGKWKGEIGEGRVIYTSVLWWYAVDLGCPLPMPVLCIGHQETRGEARDVLTCAYGLYRLLVVLVRGEFDPAEGEILVR